MIQPTQRTAPSGQAKCASAEAEGVPYETLQGDVVPGDQGNRRILKVDPLAQTIADNAATTAGSVTTVDVNWHLFEVHLVPLIVGLSDAINPALSTLIGHVNPILKILLTIYIMVIGIQMSISPSGLPDPATHLECYPWRGNCGPSCQHSNIQRMDRRRLPEDDSE